MRSSLTQRSKHILLGSLSLATDTACFARAESHTKAIVICPALALLASGSPWWQICVPPSGKTLLSSLALNHIPRQASSIRRSRCLLVAPLVADLRYLVARHCLLHSHKITYQDSIELEAPRSRPPSQLIRPLEPSHRCRKLLLLFTFALLI